MSASDVPSEEFFELSTLVINDDLESLRLIVESRSLQGSDVLGPCLLLAASEGKVDVASLLIDLGADVNYRTLEGETPFSFACANDRLDVAKLLYANGADINSVVAGGVTPLDWAVCWASPEFRSWLKGIGGVRKSMFDEWPWLPPSKPH